MFLLTNSSRQEGSTAKQRMIAEVDTSNIKFSSGLKFKIPDEKTRARGGKDGDIERHTFRLDGRNSLLPVSQRSGRR